MSPAIRQSLSGSVPAEPQHEVLIERILETLRLHKKPIGYRSLRNEVQAKRDDFISALGLLVRSGLVIRTAAGRFRLSDSDRRGVNI